MADQPRLKRVLSLMDATMINAGGIIGSGIFMVPATVALYTASSSLFFMVWIFGGIISLFGALSVAELGATMPKAGMVIADITFTPEVSKPALLMLPSRICFKKISPKP